MRVDLTLAEKPQVGPSSEPIVVGQRLMLESAALGEARAVDLYLPPSYELSNESRTYPLIVVLDAEFMAQTVVGVTGHLASVGRMPESIVVGIPNNTRRRLALYPDFLDENGQRGRPGRSDAYLRFFADELLPELDRRLRIADFRTLIGLSPTAAFTLHLLWREPELFDAHVAMVVGHVLGYEYEKGRSLTDAVVDSVLGRKGEHSFLYIGSASANFAEKPAIGEYFEELEKRLAPRRKDGLQLKTEVVEGAAYAVVLPALMSAFELLYPVARWDVNYPQLAEGEGDPAAKLDALFGGLSEEYGFPVVPLGDRFYNINCLRYLGSLLQREGRLEESIAIFQRWIDHYPKDPQPYFYQARVLAAASQGEAALTAATTGLEKARAKGDPRLTDYEERFKAFEKSIFDEAAATDQH